MNLKRSVCFLAMFAIISVNGSCAVKKSSLLIINNPGNVEWPDRQLRKNFEVYWTFRKNGDVENVLKFEAPYVRIMADPERYETFIAAGKKTVWNAVRIESIEWKNQSLLFIGFTAEVKDENSPVRTRETYFVDRWVYMDEKWYHAFDDPFINPDK